MLKKKKAVLLPWALYSACSFSFLSMRSFILAFTTSLYSLTLWPLEMCLLSLFVYWNGSRVVSWSPSPGASSPSFDEQRQLCSGQGLGLSSQMIQIQAQALLSLWVWTDVSQSLTYLRLDFFICRMEDDSGAVRIKWVNAQKLPATP